MPPIAIVIVSLHGLRIHPIARRQTSGSVASLRARPITFRQPSEGRARLPVSRACLKDQAGLLCASQSTLGGEVSCRQLGDYRRTRGSSRSPFPARDQFRCARLLEISPCRAHSGPRLTRVVPCSIVLLMSAVEMTSLPRLQAVSLSLCCCRS